MWRRREIENYFCTEDVLMAYARHNIPDDLFGQAESAAREQVMREAIAEVSAALTTLGKPSPWSADIKASDDFLDPLFRKFFEKLHLPLQLRKAEYHVLARLMPAGDLDEEIVQKLDTIVTTAGASHPQA